jgi:hypothetical protein
VHDIKPFGSYPEFAVWTGRPRAWGEGWKGRGEDKDAWMTELQEPIGLRLRRKK